MQRTWTAKSNLLLNLNLHYVHYAYAARALREIQCSGSAIFSNMLDFAVCARLMRVACPLPVISH